MKIVEYKLVEASMMLNSLASGEHEGRSYTTAINELLRQGWELYGNPIALPEIDDRCPRFAQAMVKYAKPKTKSRRKG